VRSVRGSLYGTPGGVRAKRARRMAARSLRWGPKTTQTCAAYFQRSVLLRWVLADESAHRL
jgi:hypothetical protein